MNEKTLPTKILVTYASRNGAMAGVSEAVGKTLADPAAGQDLAGELARQSIEIDVLVNNAGTQVYGEFAAASLEQLIVEPFAISEEKNKMSQTILNQGPNIETPDSQWKSLYKVGGVAALLAVLAFLLDIAITFVGEDFNPATPTAIDWFSLFQRNELSGLRALGFINIISLTMSVALFFALYAAHRQGSPAYAALALILYLMGATIYISNNAAIPMFVLSEKYAVATTDAQRTLIAAAGEAILARGADFAPGSFIGFFFTEITGFAFSLMMLRSRIFSKATALVGILGFILLSIFTIWATFIPAFFDIAMILATVGGLLSIAWYVLVSRRLFQLGMGITNIKTNQKSLVASQ